MKDLIIIYDFDGTLTNLKIPTYKFLENLGYDNYKLENRIYKYMSDTNKDFYESFWLNILNILDENKIPKINDVLTVGSYDIEYNLGVINYFEKIKDLKVKNYIVSSGMKIYLENTQVSKYMDRIYATTFKYNNDAISGLNDIITEQAKVDKIKEILKLNNILNDDCSNVIYIGDGLTDYYALDFVSRNNGNSIYLVYNEEDIKDAKKLLEEKVITNYFENDFSESSKLYKHIIYKIKSN